QPDAVWNSRPKDEKAEPKKASQSPRAKALRAASPKRVGAGTMPTFVAPQLCTSATQPPSGDDWVHEIKL
ncbi:hypothetical protein ACEV8T_22895, partial [Vibrio parahaemolyticus]